MSGSIWTMRICSAILAIMALVMAVMSEEGIAPANCETAMADVSSDCSPGDIPMPIISCGMTRNVRAAPKARAEIVPSADATVAPPRSSATIPPTAPMITNVIIAL